MPPKKSPDDSHSITLEDKVTMIKRHEKGESCSIARSFGIG